MHDGNRTSQINGLIGLLRKNDRAARAARLLMSFSKRRREIFLFEVLTATRARSSKSLILCLCMITIGIKQVKVHLAFFCMQRDQHGIIAKWLTQSSILM